MMPPRIDVTRAEIAIVVDLFYAKVRQHPVLGPVFGVHVTDWDHHTAKIADFWANALLHERVYDGNPMQKHLSAGNVQAEHFAIWLALFDDVLAAALDSPLADADDARVGLVRARWRAPTHRAL